MRFEHEAFHMKTQLDWLTFIIVDVVIKLLGKPIPWCSNTLKDEKHNKIYELEAKSENGSAPLFEVKPIKSNKNYGLEAKSENWSACFFKVKRTSYGNKKIPNMFEFNAIIKLILVQLLIVKPKIVRLWLGLFLCVIIWSTHFSEASSLCLKW